MNKSVTKSLDHEKPDTAAESHFFFGDDLI